MCRCAWTKFPVLLVSILLDSPKRGRNRHWKLRATQPSVHSAQGSKLSLTCDSLLGRNKSLLSTRCGPLPPRIRVCAEKLMPELGNVALLYWMHQRPNFLILWLKYISLATGSHPNHAALRPQMTAGAGALLHISVDKVAPLRVKLDPAVVAATSRLGDALMQLAAAPPPAVAPPQMSLLLDCEVQCTVQASKTAIFILDARSVCVTACSSIGSVIGSSAAALAIGSLELTCPCSSNQRQLQLAFARRVQLTGESEPLPAVELLAIFR